MFLNLSEMKKKNTRTTTLPTILCTMFDTTRVIERASVFSLIFIFITFFRPTDF